MLKKISALVSVAALLAACSSPVKLDEPPVQDLGTSSSGASGVGGTGADTGRGGQSGVAPVDLNRTAQEGQGPVGVARVVYFDFDSYVIKPEYQQLIESHARFLRGNSARHIVIEGHTDERGGREYNLALGQRRAEAVQRAFGLLGVGESQVEAVSFGKEKPAVPGSSEDAYAQNRRAEISYRR